MPVTEVEPIDAVFRDDPRVLDDAGLKVRVAALMKLRSCVDATLLAATGELEARKASVSDGSIDTRAWLAHHTAIGRATAGALVWLTKRLRYMPAFAQALAEGAITYDHVRVMAKALNVRTLEVFVRDEALLVGHAMQLEADDFALAVARWKFLADPDGPDQERVKPSELHVSPMLDGRHRLDGELDLDDSVEFLAELDARYEEIWQDDHSTNGTDQERHRSASQRYAAALVEMARRSSMAGDPKVDDGTPVTIRTTARKTQIVVVVEPDALAGDPRARAELDDGTPVPQAVLQRWACDSAIGRVAMQGSSVPFDLGRITYTASDGQRRVLNVRDRGCIVPGCRRKPRWCQAHHVVPWPVGPTDIHNLVLVCHRHHRHVHDGIIKIRSGDRVGTFVVTRADGSPLLQRPPPTLIAV